jgi:hypothetical protein
MRCLTSAVTNGVVYSYGASHLYNGRSHTTYGKVTPRYVDIEHGPYDTKQKMAKTHHIHLLEELVRNATGAESDHIS